MPNTISNCSRCGALLEGNQIICLKCGTSDLPEREVLISTRTKMTLESFTEHLWGLFGGEIYEDDVEILFDYLEDNFFSERVIERVTSQINRHLNDALFLLVQEQKNMNIIDDLIMRREK